MSRAAALIDALTDEPTSTSELYDRVGYSTLVRVGLVPYERFREELSKLAASGIVERDTAEDGSTRWRRSTEGDPGK